MTTKMCIFYNILAILSNYLYIKEKGDTICTQN